jgi:hypothetical protein
LDAALPCSNCHTPLEEHGGTRLSSGASCDACHHRAVEPGNCAQCHAGPGGVPDTVFALPVGDFVHQPHTGIGLACSMCHQPPAMSATELECANCHGPHHQPEATCVSCHRDGALSKHSSAVHEMACTLCHGDAMKGVEQWSRQVCTACHADRTEHNAPVACDLCHTMTPLGGGGGDSG